MADPVFTPFTSPTGQDRVRMFWYFAGEKHRKTFKSRKEADTFVRKAKKSSGVVERSLVDASAVEQADIIAALELSRLHKFKLLDAARQFVESKPKPLAALSVEGAERKWFQRCQDENIRDATIYNYERALRMLRMKVGKHPAELTEDDVSEFLRTWHAATRNWYLRHLRPVFSWWAEQGVIAANPFARVKKAKTDWHPPCILTSTEAATLMETATELDTGVVPYLAIGLFAGIRPTGIQRLSWEDIDLRKKVIRITGTTNKTRGGFAVEIRPNLLKWLRSVEGAEIIPSNHRKRYEAVRDVAGTTWGPDVMRHSFASHHLAAFKDPVETADQLGHEGDATMLFKHYRSKVSQAEGKRFFAIVP